MTRSEPKDRATPPVTSETADLAATTPDSGTRMSEAEMAMLEPIGVILRRVREGRGYSLEEVTRRLRIRGDILVALEEQRYEDLPEELYVLGFLRSYAIFLGLDGDAALTLFKYQSANRLSSPEHHAILPEQSEATLGIWLLSLAVLLFFLGLTIYGFLKLADLPSVESVNVGRIDIAEPPVLAPLPEEERHDFALILPEEEGVLSAVEEQQSQTRFTALPPPRRIYGDATLSGQIEIRVTEESWISLHDTTGRRLYEGILLPDEAYRLPQQTRAQLIMENAAALQIWRNGQAVEQSFGEEREVLRLELE